MAVNTALVCTEQLPQTGEILLGRDSRLAPLKSPQQKNRSIDQTSQEDASFSQRPTSEWSSFNLLKHPGESFVGRREELRSLKRGLRGTQMRVGIVTGPGGIGKSSLLYRLWKASESRFRSAFNIDCASCPDAAQILAQISNWLLSHGNQILEQARKNDRLSLKEQASAAVQALEHDGPYLLGLDNFESILTAGPDAPVPKDDTISHLLHLFARGLKKSKVLIASRTSFAIDSPSGAVVITPLHDLNEKEAACLMRQLPRLSQVGNPEKHQALWLGACCRNH